MSTSPPDEDSLYLNLLRFRFILECLSGILDAMCPGKLDSEKMAKDRGLL